MKNAHILATFVALVVGAGSGYWVGGSIEGFKAQVRFLQMKEECIQVKVNCPCRHDNGDPLGSPLGATQEQELE